MLHLQHNTLHLIDTLWLGGAQRVVKNIFEHNTSEERLHLLVLRETPDMIPILHPRVTRVATGKKWALGIAFRAIAGYVREHRIQTLHCHLPKSQTLGLLLKKHAIPNLRLIFQEQGDIMDRLPLNLPAYLLGRKQIDKVICCSEAVRQRLLSITKLDNRQASVIHNFAATAAPEPEPVSADRKEKHIGFAGRITRHKGWRDFLEAAFLAGMEMTGKNKLIIHIAGTGPEYPQLKKMIRQKNMESAVLLHGFVKDMQSFYRRLDLLCMPSHKEPMGMVHLEAMHYGVPVVASDVPGMNEILKHGYNGLLFEARQPQQIKEAMLQVMNDQSLADRLVANGRYTTAAYDYCYFEQQLNDIYERLSV